MVEKSFNATYVVLIPKKNGAKELTDFRPISIIGLSISWFPRSSLKNSKIGDDTLIFL